MRLTVLDDAAYHTFASDTILTYQVIHETITISPPVHIATALLELLGVLFRRKTSTFCGKHADNFWSKIISTSACADASPSPHISLGKVKPNATPTGPAAASARVVRQAPRCLGLERRWSHAHPNNHVGRHCSDILRLTNMS